MKRFLIHVDTNWCGEEDTFRAVAESEIELWDIAEQLAYDNFYSFGHDQDIAEEEGYDPDEMTDEDWDEMCIAEKSMGRTVDITTLPNHINNEHVHIFRWLDGCGWTIKCGNIHIESSNIEDAIMDFLKFTSELDIVHEHRGYGLVGKVGVFHKTIDNHGYFY